jgi:UDP-GlcNAc:undecaprenyl-phosphate/decaprenyl-phosphate GlcNAc-1-phosphate transferase
MFVLLLAPLTALIISLVSMPLIIRLCHRMEWFDDQDHRKIHSGSIGRLGGLGFFFAFVVSSVIFTILLAGQITLPVSWSFRILFVLAAGVIIFTFGVWDDLRNLHARNKIVIQLVAAVLVLAADFTFRKTAIPFVEGTLQFGLFRFPLTLIWIVGVINAVNMIDGADGLAGGITSIAAVSFGILFLMRGNVQAAMYSFVLAGAVWGFLVVNLPPAKLFMGDGGSQFLGFMVAVLPLIDQGSGEGSISLAHAGVILSIPIFDTIAAVWRRVRDKRHIFSPDRGHIHHKLNNLGFNSWGLLVVLYGLQIALSAIAVASARQEQEYGLVFLLAALLMVALFFSVIHFANKNAKRRNGNTDQPGKEG